MLNPASTKVAEQLRNVFVRERFASFQFDDQFAFDEQIGKVVTENGAILIQNL